jgi:hypothetical protein
MHWCSSSSPSGFCGQGFLHASTAVATRGLKKGAQKRKGDAAMVAAEGQ